MEYLAATQHNIWSHWMTYMFKCGIYNEDGSWTMPKDKVERWLTQAGTIYDDLSETKKQSDRDIVKAFACDSDGYHTFDELYEFRKMYNAALFNEWAKISVNNPNYIIDDNCHQPYLPKFNVHKSWRHYDGELCFGGGWFIVVALLPTGQISNHYEAKDWNLFKIPETETAKYPFDGHTPQDVLQRLKDLTNV